mmetsp:Transcript_8388/g.9577  ORF Transcript_8388/g.9577 Transcript_8388/m.9577 type:complete len:271 (+) Transcript_8388:214-1026(+)
MSVARIVGSAVQPEIVEHEIIIPEGAIPNHGFSAEIDDGRNIFVVCPSGSSPGDSIVIQVPLPSSGKTPPPFYETEIPKGVSSGQTFPVTLPDGITVSVTCPEGVTAGQTMRFQGPSMKSELQRILEKSKSALSSVKAQVPKSVDELKSIGKKIGGVSGKLDKAKAAMKNKKKALLEQGKAKGKTLLAAGKAKVTQQVMDATISKELKELQNQNEDLVKAGKTAAHVWDRSTPFQKKMIVTAACVVLEVPIPPSLAVAACDAVGVAVKKV